MGTKIQYLGQLQKTAPDHYPSFPIATKHSPPTTQLRPSDYHEA